MEEVVLVRKSEDEDAGKRFIGDSRVVWRDFGIAPIESLSSASCTLKIYLPARNTHYPSPEFRVPYLCSTRTQLADLILNAFGRSFPFYEIDQVHWVCYTITVVMSVTFGSRYGGQAPGI